MDEFSADALKINAHAYTRVWSAVIFYKMYRMLYVDGLEVNFMQLLNRSLGQKEVKLLCV